MMKWKLQGRRCYQAVALCRHRTGRTAATKTDRIPDRQARSDTGTSKIQVQTVNSAVACLVPTLLTSMT